MAPALYLTCACLAGDPAALRAMEEHYMPDVERAIARMRIPAADVDDIVQVLRQQLFVGDAGARPRITEYSGMDATLGSLLRGSGSH